MNYLYREVTCINASNIKAKISQIFIKRMNILILYNTTYPNIFYSIVMKSFIIIISRLTVQKQPYSLKTTTQFSFTPMLSKLCKEINNTTELERVNFTIRTNLQKT